MECLPTEVALAVLEGEFEEEPQKIRISEGDVLKLEGSEALFNAQPKKVALWQDAAPRKPRGEAAQEQRELSVPKPPPQMPPPDLPPALPLTLPAPEPPTPPPFVPALQPPQQPLLRCTALPAPLPSSLPPALPPSLPESFPASLPPPFPPSLPGAAPTATVPLLEPHLLPPGFSAEVLSAPLYCQSGAALTCTAPPDFQWYPPLHSVVGLELAGHTRQYFGSRQNAEQPCNVTNPGSALHGTGNCHPCAWFWKSPGCRNGANCDHCHFCPEGEVKARKKARQTIKRLGLATPQKMNSSHSITDAFSPSPEMTPSTMPKSPGRSELESTTGSASDREWMVGSGSEHDLNGDSDHDEVSPLPRAPSLPRPPPGLEPPSDVPSAGSVLHGFGECSPCAWFWKAVGCNNGRDCAFCHSCPQGAAKARKKSRRSKAAGGGGMLAATPTSTC